jgi:DnaJ-class molecular chaperone
VWQSEEEGHPWQQAVPSWADFPPSPSTTEPTQTMEEESERGHDSEPEQKPAAPAERPLTHYEVLNMPRDASTSELRSAWKKGCLARHPDKPWGNAAAFLQLSKAWEVLGDPISRASYDASM